MGSIVWFWIILVGVACASYKRLTLLNTTALITLLMILGSLFGGVSIWAWLAFALILTPLNLAHFRITYITLPLLKLYQKVMPQMSQTEKDAIDAGTVWWDGELFSGKPNWQTLHRFPKLRLSPAEQAFLDGPVDTVCSMVDEWQINHVDADLSSEIWAYLKKHKFFAMIIKKQYGGLEFSAFAQSRVLQKLSSCGGVLASTVGVPNSLGPGELLQYYGTEQQKEYYLPKLALGEEIPCFALTSPEAGSDAGAIPDTGIVCRGEFNGENVLGIKLNFNKRYITLAPVATVIGLAFKLYDPDHLLGDKYDLGITCALIPRETKGLTIGRRHLPLNSPFQNGPIQGHDVFVPLDFIIGGVQMAGKGWRMLMECLSVGRCITLPSTSTGAAKSIAMATGAYARIRRQFRLPIGHMEGVEEMLARIGGNAYLMDAVTRFSTAGVDLGEKPSVISAICKYHLTEKMRTVVNDSMDVHGGKGVMLGPNNYLGRAYQGVPISITVEGANILTRNMMIFGQGAIRCHPYVLKELQAAALVHQEDQVSQFDKAIFGHIGFALSNTIASLWFALTAGYFNKRPFTDASGRYYQLLSGYSANLALLSDISMAMLGGDLKRRERISARLGDMLSYMYLASATLKRFDEDGRLHEDIPLLHWAMQDSLFQLESAMLSFFDNFPNKTLGMVLKIVLLPCGRRVSAPSDKLEHQIAQILQTPGSARSRLGEGQYLTRENASLQGDLEQTLDDIIAAEPIFNEICQRKGEKCQFSQLDELAKEALDNQWISATQAELLVRAEQGRLRTINVDDFSDAELKSTKVA